MGATILDIVRVLERLAPLETAMPWDNVGLMIGSTCSPVTKVLLAVDVNLSTLAQAQKLGAELIVAHHPLFLDPIRSLREDTPEGRLVAQAIRSGIGVYCAHTNFDICPIGTSRSLALAAGAKAEDIVQDQFLCVSPLEGTNVRALAQTLQEHLPSPYVNVFGERDVHRAAFCAGSGNGEMEAVLQSGADVFVCGEIKYHQMCPYIERGVAVIACGHRESEAPGMRALLQHLQNEESLLQYKMRFGMADLRCACV